MLFCKGGRIMQRSLSAKSKILFTLIVVILFFGNFSFSIHSQEMEEQNLILEEISSLDECSYNKLENSVLGLLDESNISDFLEKIRAKSVIEKNSTYPKVQPGLLDIINKSHVSISTSLNSLKYEFVDDLIRVEISLISEESLIFLKDFSEDIEIETSYQNLVQALVPLNTIKDLSNQDFVNYIKNPAKPYFFDIESEGVQIIGADLVHDQGIDGSDVKVAVIDGGFTDYNTNPELPSERIKEVKSFRSDGEVHVSKHGTACAEIILDVAPNADLYLYVISTNIEFLNAIDYAVSKGVDVISFSGCFFNQNDLDGTGIICDAVNNARSAGVLVTVSAGNFAEKHYCGWYVDNDDNDLHDFDTGNNFLSLGYIPAYYPITLYLSWNDWPYSNQDYDLYLFSYYYGLLVVSENPQTGSQPPTESIEVYATVDDIWFVFIAKYSATQPVRFQLFSYTCNFQDNVHPETSITVPADATGAMTVGATYWSNDNLESYSSRGPTNDGRIKPDVTAPTGVSTYAYGPGNFYGTSASAPHVAGAAALLLSNGHLCTADDLQSVLESTALDLGTSGKNNLYGSGRIDVWDAYLSMKPTADFTYSPIDPSTQCIIQFTDASVYNNGDVISWFWDFGDGTTSTIQNPTHQYTNAGDFLVSLTVTNNYGVTDTFNDTIIVKPLSHPAPAVDFIATMINRVQINLSWNTGVNTSHTYIEWYDTETWDRGEGNELYNDTGTSYSHTGLYPDTAYYYQAWSYNSTSGLWNETAAVTQNTTEINLPPILDQVNPVNNSLKQDLSFIWSLRIRDTEGDSFDWAIECSNNQISSDIGDVNGTKQLSLSNLDYETEYTVWVNVTDIYDGETREWFKFTTRDENEPEPPGDFTATPDGRFIIDMAWNKGDKADKTHVRYAEGSTPPEDRDSGVLLYNDTEASAFVDGLESGTTYSFSAWSWNATDNAWSARVTDTATTDFSLPEPSISFHAATHNITQIDLTWVKGGNATHTYIRYAEGDIPPENRESGTFLYNDTGISTSAIGLKTNTQYSFSAWSYNSTRGLWNETFVSTNATTDKIHPSGLVNFTATADGRFKIDLSWEKGNNTDYSYIRYSEGSTPPASRDSGIFLYNDTVTSTFVDNLNQNTQYSFSAWSWNATYNTWSARTTCNTNTDANLPPVIINENPEDGDTGIDKLYSHLSVDIEDPEGDLMNWTIEGQYITNDGDYYSGNTTIFANLITPLPYDTLITWYVNVTDGFGWIREVFTFTTRDAYTDSNPIGFSAEAYGRFKIDLTWTKGFNADKTYIEYHSSADSGWNIGDHTFLYNDTGESAFLAGLNPSQTVYFKAWGWNETDGVYSIGVTDDYTTVANNPPEFSYENPDNTSDNQELSFIWSITIEDPEGDTFNWTIQCSNGQSNSSTDDTNGSKELSLTNLDYNKQYTIWVNATDIYAGETQEWYAFSTIEAELPEIQNVSVKPCITEKNGFVNISYDVKQGSLMVNNTITISGPGNYKHTKNYSDPGFGSFFYNTSYNISGNYSFNIVAIDADNNECYSDNYYFWVVDNITIIEINYTGELFIEWKDVNLSGNFSKNTNVTFVEYAENPHPEHLPTNALQKFINIEIDDSENSVNWPINITWYYTTDDLNDSNISSDDLLGLYFWNETSEKWMLYNDTGVNTTCDTDGYVGFIWANIWHLTSLVAGGDSEPPGQVTGLSVSDAKDGKLNLEWNPATDNVAVSFYNIYWGEDDYETAIETVDHPTTNYQHTGLNNNQEYCYRVSAVDTSNNEGKKSEKSCGTPTATSQTPPGATPPGATPPGPTPTAPVADAGGPYEGFPDENIEFDGSASYAQEGKTIVGYRWDFTGDDIWDTDWLTTPFANHTYITQGVYTVKLEVKDSGDLTDTDTTTVTILAGNYAPTQPEVTGETSGSKNINYTYTAVSTDPENDTIQYTFDWGDGTNTTTDFLHNATIATVNHSWAAAGKYYMWVQAMDDKNDSSLRTELTILIDAINVGDIGYLTDDNANGTYDIYYSNDGDIETIVEEIDDNEYLLDTTGDGEYNHIFGYNEETDEWKLTEYAPVVEPEPVDEDGVTLLYVGVILIIIILLLLFFLATRKKDKIKK
jgi:hypothetical protein